MKNGVSISNFRAALLGCVLTVSWLSPVQADQFNLVVHPVYTPDRAAEVFGPLVTYLNENTGHQITLITPKNFHLYWAELRKQDDWHLIYDDAHMTDYLARKRGYEPLSKVSDPASFTLISGTGRTDETLRDFIARRIVTMPSPSLGFSLLVAQWYSNPLQQPVIVSSASSWRDTVEIVFAQEAEAAMVPTWLAERYPNLLPVRKTDDMPGAAVSASSSVSAAAKAAIRDALNKLHENDQYYEVLVELNITRFETASPEDYQGQADLMKGFYGF